MSHFLLYEPAALVVSARNELSVNIAAGHDRSVGEAVREGDVLWLARSHEAGRLALIWRVAVSLVTDDRDRVRERIGRRHQEYGAGWFAIGSATAARAKEPGVDVSALAADLRFAGSPDRLPANFSGRDLHGRPLLTDASRDLLERAWLRGVKAGRNPPWERSELILALDLYIRLGGPVDDEHPEVLALSLRLNALAAASLEGSGPPPIRGPRSIAAKLVAFRVIERTGKPKGRGNRLEWDVWETYAHDPRELRRAAADVLTRHVVEGVTPQEETAWRDRPSSPDLDAPLRTRSPAEKELDDEYSYAIGARTVDVVPRHERYKSRLNKFLEARDVWRENERDYIDIRFMAAGRLCIGEIKVQTKKITAPDAFRLALGQVLDYGYTRFTGVIPGLVMFLDHRPRATRVQLASLVGVAVVFERDEDQFELLNIEPVPELTEIFPLADAPADKQG